MCWQCDHPDKTLDDYLALLRADDRVARLGSATRRKRPRPFAYTIGLHDRGLPELLVDRPAPETGPLAAEHVRQADDWPVCGPLPGDQVSLPAGTRLELVDVEHPDAHMGMAIAIEGPDITAVQLVWADSRGRWPWAPGFDDGNRHQPVLGARTQTG